MYTELNLLCKTSTSVTEDPQINMEEPHTHHIYLPRL